ncbi:MAG: hypothetical protein Q9181_003385 [Wetmoreana brouardii]
MIRDVFGNPEALHTLWKGLKIKFDDDQECLSSKKQPIIVLCYDGDTSQIATSMLRAKGYKAFSVCGGFLALWKLATHRRRQGHEHIGDEAVDSVSGTTVDKERTGEVTSVSNLHILVADTEKTVSPIAGEAVDDQPRDATEEEIKALRHVNDRIPIAAWIVILAGAAERATYFGIIAPWRTLTLAPALPFLPYEFGKGMTFWFAENYMQNARESNGTPGALGLGQSTATNIFNAFFLFSFLTPMLFALLSDLYIGRYKSLMAGLAYVESKIPTWPEGLCS